MAGDDHVSAFARATPPSQRADGLIVRERRAIDGDESERHGVPGHPLEVVDQGPVEVAANVDALRSGGPTTPFGPNRSRV